MARHSLIGSGLEEKKNKKEQQTDEEDEDEADEEDVRVVQWRWLFGFVALCAIR